MTTPVSAAPRRMPLQGWVGLALVLVIWPVNWTLEGMRTHLLFAPLWVGFTLAVDGLCVWRSGTSIFTRSKILWLQLFVLSAPVWWLFELFNRRLANWEYVSSRPIGDLEYVLLCSLSFSTVMPAVLTTSELARHTLFARRGAEGPRIAITPRRLWSCASLGAVMLVAMLIWPRWLYALEWVALVFLLEPLAFALGRRSFLVDLGRGDWRTWASLWVGGLTCGFFWELWNSQSDPKWIYHVPGVDFARVFEMPLLGYLGYLPFAMELWLMAQLCLPRARELRV